MKTTRQPARDSSQNQTTDFTDALGRKISATAFENDAGPPEKPRLSEAGQQMFDKDTADVLAAAKALRARSQ